jgi:hypothetical protein
MTETIVVTRSSQGAETPKDKPTLPVCLRSTESPEIITDQPAEKNKRQDVLKNLTDSEALSLLLNHDGVRKQYQEACSARLREYKESLHREYNHKLAEIESCAQDWKLSLATRTQHSRRCYSQMVNISELEDPINTAKDFDPPVPSVNSDWSTQKDIDYPTLPRGAIPHGMPDKALGKKLPHLLLERVVRGKILLSMSSPGPSIEDTRILFRTGNTHEYQELMDYNTRLPPIKGDITWKDVILKPTTRNLHVLLKAFVFLRSRKSSLVGRWKEKYPERVSSLRPQHYEDIDEDKLRRALEVFKCPETLTVNVFAPHQFNRDGSLREQKHIGASVQSKLLVARGQRFRMPLWTEYQISYWDVVTGKTEPQHSPFDVIIPESESTFRRLSMLVRNLTPQEWKALRCSGDGRTKQSIPPPLVTKAESRSRNGGGGSRETSKVSSLRSVSAIPLPAIVKKMESHLLATSTHTTSPCDNATAPSESTSSDRTGVSTDSRNNQVDHAHASDSDVVLTGSRKRRRGNPATVDLVTEPGRPAKRVEFDTTLQVH